MPRQTLYVSSAVQSEPWPPAGPPAEPLSNEPSLRVFQAACAAIASELGSLGFKYAKSKLRCHRTVQEFGNTVKFRTSHYNSSGRHVQLWMYATVSSHALQQWRAERLPPQYATDHVAGGMVHRLSTSYAFVQWELADPADRAATISDAVDFIRTEVLPYFARFEDVPSLVSFLQNEPIPAMELMSQLEFCYCFGGKSAAQGALDRFIRDRPDLQPMIEDAEVKAAAAQRIHPGNYGEQIVFLRRHLHLG